VRLPLPAPPLVAVGGELKATAAVAAGALAWLSQHLGDTEHLETLAMLARSVETLAALEQVTPSALVSDAHPGYLSHGWAHDRAAELGVPHLVVQHHHAHLASLLAEHGIPADQPVLGLVFDGTGYGGDGTIWGGELLLGSYASVQRVGHLRAVLLPGGDAAVRHPARVAIAHLTAAGIDPAGTASAAALGVADLRLLGRLLATGSHCVPTTSGGRLFDAIASLLDVRHTVDYEAQAAIELEALAARAMGTTDVPPPAPLPAAPSGAEQGHLGAPPGSLPVRAPHGSLPALGRAGVPAADAQGPALPVVLDPTPWLATAVAAHAEGRPVPDAALAFHRALADALTEAAVTVRARFGTSTVGLSGGVFANAVLTELCVERLRAAGFVVLTHRVVPPNDGGLALGQVVVAAAGGARTLAAGGAS
jgi:hydrogenase maturation protein HypF